MRLRSCFRFLSPLLVVSVFACAMMAQDHAPAAANAGPPKFLKMVHRQLKPGMSGAYDDQEKSLARIYNRDNLQVYWLELESMTGPSEVLSLELFDSMDELGKAADVLRAGFKADPRLKQMQDRLLEDNISSETSVLGVRRDDMGYRANSIDFSKMRLLRLTTIFAHPGYERAFMETEWSLSEASEKLNAKVAWAVYEVTDGLPQPSFVIVTPMQSPQDMDDALETDQALKSAEGGALEEHLQELARIAFGAGDSRLFSVDPEASHVSKEFAAGSPSFWSPAELSPPRSAAPKGRATPKAPAL